MLHHLTAKDVGRGHGISARNDKHIELKQNISYTPPPHDLLFLTIAQGQLKSINRGGERIFPCRVSRKRIR